MEGEFESELQGENCLSSNGCTDNWHWTSPPGGVLVHRATVTCFLLQLFQPTQTHFSCKPDSSFSLNSIRNLLTALLAASEWDAWEEVLSCKMEVLKLKLVKIKAVSSSCLCLSCIWECLCSHFSGHYHQNRGVWRRSLSMSLVQVTGVCTQDLKVPVLAVTHVHITDTYCFQYELFKKCQETSCICTLLQRQSMPVLQSQALKELVPAASLFILLVSHCVVFFSTVALGQHSTLDTPGTGMDRATRLAQGALPSLCQKLESVQESGGRLKELKGWRQYLMAEVFKSSQRNWAQSLVPHCL
ncbi:uncharacterized protein LOC127479714 [Manacus candei]|uniref:uncharacterized protein LOC127479714 n=1 Tax=Manacus candei TaxID=415023 RepID=UPI00222740DC|nr:uncharacterized protein LOC127479714 [Manacus candei]